MNWPIFSLNFVPVGAGFSRMARSGERRVAILESREKSAVIISRFRLGDTWRASFIAAQIAARNFHASAASAVPSRAWLVAARIMVENSTCGSDYGGFLTAAVWGSRSHVAERHYST